MALQLSKHFSILILFVCSWCVRHLPVLLKVSASVSEFCCLWGCAIKTQLWQMAPLLHTNTYTCFCHPSLRRSSSSYRACYCPIFMGWRSGPLWWLTCGPPVQDPDDGHLHQDASLSWLTVQHILFYAHVMKSSITRSVWAHLSVIEQCIYVLGYSGRRDLCAEQTNAHV